MIALTSLLLALTAPPVLPAGSTVPVTTSSTVRDYALTTGGACPTEEMATYACMVPATLIVRDHGSSRERQRIELERVAVVFDDEAPTPRWTVTSKAFDANFDGQEDLALTDSQEGPYGSLTYAIFVADGGALKLSEDLSAITRENIDLFEVEHRRQRLVTGSKSGCCIHYRREYAFLPGAAGESKVTLVDEVEDDGRDRDHGQVIHRRLVRGKWRTTRRRLRESVDR